MTNQGILKQSKVFLQHPGELKLRKLLNIPKELSDSMADWPSSHLGHRAYFLDNVPLVVTATFDANGRPWASLLTGGVKPQSMTEIGLTVPNRSAWSPLTDTGPFHTSGLFAGLAIHFASRSRLKLAGTVAPANPKTPDTHEFTVTLDEVMGNCPKYIDAMELQPIERDHPKSNEILHETDNQPLSDEARDLISNASVTFLATRHLGAESHTSADLNHRGGAPGFVRVSKDNRTLVLPDYSGNRIFSSLGNIESDRVAGLTFIDFHTGDILYVTGEAQILIGDDSRRIMPRASTITTLQVNGWALIKGGLDLELIGEVERSPYNPPVYRLSEEMAKGEELAMMGQAGNLESAVQLSPTMAAFTARLEEPVTVLPGQYGILDVSAVFPPRSYKHMNEQNPQQVNDDMIRTWTVAAVSPDNRELTFIIKKVHRGLVSGRLHQEMKYAEMSETTPEETKTAWEPVSTPNAKVGTFQRDLPVSLRGVGGEFSCFATPTTLRESCSSGMVWLAAGSGVTPFVAMWRGMQENNLDAPVSMLYTHRGEVEGEWCKAAFAGVPSLTMHDSTKGSRVDADAVLKAVNAVPSDAPIFVCGPTAFSDSVMGWLQQAEVSKERILTESFEF